MKRRYKSFLTLTLIFFGNIVHGQIASYPFKNDLIDGIGNHDGSVVAESVSFDPEGFLSLDGGAIALPANLTNNILDSGSIKIKFEFRVDPTNEYTLLLSASDKNTSASWSRKGFRLLNDRGELTFNYSNGDNDPNHYDWSGFQQIESNKWYTLDLTINLALKRYRISLDGESIIHSFLPFVDTDSLKAGIQKNRITIGGMNAQLENGYQGGLDIRNLSIYAPAPTDLDTIKAIYLEFRDALEGKNNLSEDQLRSRLNFTENNLPFLKIEEILPDMLAYSETYELLNPPMYQDGVTKYYDELPVFDRLLQFSQEHILQELFVPGKVQHAEGLIFEHHKVIPGQVPDGTIRIPSAVVELNGTYKTDPGADLVDQTRVVRPTGYYLAAGDLVTIKAPPNAVNKGLSIVVGSHFRNMEYDYIGPINRFPDISTEFPLDTVQMVIGNPFGGGIYLKVPDGASIGWFEITIENAIKSPYFSWREGRHTDLADWSNQVATTGAPWADFESDKFMFTIPIQELHDVTNPDAIMSRWDAMMDVIRYSAGRPQERPRSEYYTFDTRLVTPAYGAGYPLVIPISEMRQEQRWNPLKVQDLMPHPTLLHEMGHNHGDPTLNFGPDYDACFFIEAETIVHMLGVAVYNRVFGLDLDAAFQASWEVNSYTLNEACFDWIISSNFRQGLPMIYDKEAPIEDQDMLKYQPRGWAKYTDIVRLFGWEGLSAINGRFYTAGQRREDGVCPDRPFIVGRDEYIRAACETLGENVTPLFHFWGINPSEPTAGAMAAAFPKSQRVKALIETYRCEVAPTNFEDYLRYHQQMYDRTDYQKPRYDRYLEEFDDHYVVAIQGQFDFLLETYGLTGPAAPSEVSGSTNALTVQLSWADNSEDETGFIIRYRSDPEDKFVSLGNTAANTTSFDAIMPSQGTYEFQVVAVNEEGLESNVCEVETITLQVDPSVSSSDKSWKAQGFRLFPNPAHGELFLENLSDLNPDRLEIYGPLGRLVMTQKLTSGARFHPIILNRSMSGNYLVRLFAKSEPLATFKIFVVNR